MERESMFLFMFWEMILMVSEFSKIVSACAPANSKANMELIGQFIGETVIVKCADYEVQGVLVDCLPSFHRLYGSLILKDSSGIHYIRNWQIIAIKGENKDERDKAISKAWNDMQIHA